MAHLYRYFVLWFGACLFAVAAEAPSSRRLRTEFVRAMDEVMEKKKQQASLYKSLLSAAIPLKTDFTQMRSNFTMPTRRLEEGNYYDDDAYGFGIDIKGYALKYMGCQNIHTFSDDMAENANAKSVLMMNRFVVFRLCPREYCSSYNSNGCNYGFGDYMIPMEDYLQVMVNYHYIRFQRYCETCKYCMNPHDDDDFVYDNGRYDDDVDDYYAADDAVDDDYYADDDAAYDDNADNGADNGGDNYYDEDEVGDDYWNNRFRRLADAVDDDAAGDDAYAAQDDAYVDDYDEYDDGSNYTAFDPKVDCQYYKACYNYKDACRDYSSKATDYEDYFACSTFELGNRVGYLGPHCRDDGFTIGIGIYDDENCYEYVGDLVDIDRFTGMSFDDAALSPYYSQNCISCLESESFDLYSSDEEGNSVYELCGVLYDESAKCNKYIGVDDPYASEQQEQNEGVVCKFIASLIENHYDENGEIFVKGAAFDFSRWKDINEYRNFVELRVPLYQIIGILLSLFLCLGLLGYSCYLHRTISTSKEPWMPKYRLEDPISDPADVARVESGIMMLRSQSEFTGRSGYTGGRYMFQDE